MMSCSRASNLQVVLKAPLQVADHQRTRVEQGHFSRLLQDQPRPGRAGAAVFGDVVPDAHHRGNEPIVREMQGRIGLRRPATAGSPASSASAGRPAFAGLRWAPACVVPPRGRRARAPLRARTAPGRGRPLPTPAASGIRSTMRPAAACCCCVRSRWRRNWRAPPARQPRPRSASGRFLPPAANIALRMISRRGLSSTYWISSIQTDRFRSRPAWAAKLRLNSAASEAEGCWSP